VKSTCNISGCDRARVKAEGKFPGSELCASHHFKKYMNQITSPQFEFWLKEEDLRSIMMDWLATENKLEVAHFIGEVDKFRGVSRKELRAQRAPGIFQRFIESKAIKLEEKDVAELKAAVESKDGVSSTVFDPAVRDLMVVMQTVFLEKFCKTPAFIAWKESVMLPPEIHKAVKEATLRASKAHQASIKSSQEQARQEIQEAVAKAQSEGEGIPPA